METVTAPKAYSIRTPIKGLAGMRAVSLSAFFQYGSGGATCPVIVATTLDQVGPDASFDLVTNKETFCYVEDKLRYLRDVRRVLRPGGAWRTLDSALPERGLSPLGERRHPRIAQRADHRVAGGKPRAGDAVRHHLGVAQDRRAAGERGARRRHHAVAEPDVLRRLDLAAGVAHAHRHVGFLRRAADGSLIQQRIGHILFYCH